MTARLPAAAIRAFLFETAAWRGSRRVQQMTFAERGMYLELLVEQWEHGAVPATAGECAALLGGDVDEWRDAWPKLAACFEVRKRDGRLANARLARDRREREEYYASQRENGRRGGKALWNKQKTARPEDSEPVASPEQRLSLERSERSERSESEGNRKIGTIPPNPPTANGEALRGSFEAFWNAYPRKEGHDAAWQAWTAVHPDEALTARILDAVASQRRQARWNIENGRYVPLPQKWLVEGRWQDAPNVGPHASETTIKALQSAAEFVKS